jgi:hypothetical protein
LRKKYRSIFRITSATFAGRFHVLTGEFKMIEIHANRAPTSRRPISLTPLTHIRKRSAAPYLLGRRVALRISTWEGAASDVVLMLASVRASRTEHVRTPDLRSQSVDAQLRGNSMLARDRNQQIEIPAFVGLLRFAELARFLPSILVMLCSSRRRFVRLIASVLHDMFRVSVDPRVGQQRFEIRHAGSQRLQQETHISNRLNEVLLRAGQNAQTDRRRFATTVTSKKQRILAANRGHTQRSLRIVVVDRQPAILRLPSQRFPLIPERTDRLPTLALGQHCRRLLVQEQLEAIKHRHAPLPRCGQTLVDTAFPKLVFDVVIWDSRSSRTWGRRSSMP